MKGRGVEWSRKILSDIDRARGILAELERSRTVRKDIEEIERLLFEAYCNLETPYVTYEELKELFE